MRMARDGSGWQQGRLTRLRHVEQLKAIGTGAASDAGASDLSTGP